LERPEGVSNDIGKTGYFCEYPLEFRENGTGPGGLKVDPVSVLR